MGLDEKEKEENGGRGGKRRAFELGGRLPSGAESRWTPLKTYMVYAAKCAYFFSGSCIRFIKNTPISSRVLKALPCDNSQSNSKDKASVFFAF